MATVNGIAFIDDDSNSFKNVSNIYNYYDFRSTIFDREFAFNVNLFV
jgi:hypothetical protein